MKAEKTLLPPSAPPPPTMMSGVIFSPAAAIDFVTSMPAMIFQNRRMQTRARAQKIAIVRA